MCQDAPTEREKESERKRKEGREIGTVWLHKENVRASKVVRPVKNFCSSNLQASEHS